MKKILTATILLFTFLIGCGKSNSKSNDTIKIGVIEPLTGDYAQYGTAIKEGIELRIDEINKNGGINGKIIEVSYQDTKGDIQEAVNIFKNMASNGIDAVLAEAISSNTIAIAELANKAKIPMIAPAATALDVTKDKEYVFRTTFIDPYQGEMLAKYLNKENVKEVGLLTNTSSDYSIGVADKFKEVATSLGIKIVEEKYTSSDKDFKSILTKLKNANVSNVLIPDYYNTIGLILSQSQEIGLNAQFYGADGWDGIQKDFGKLAEGAIFATQFTENDGVEKTKEFVEKYKAKFSKDPLIFAALGYDTMVILEDALRKGKDLVEALKETDVDLITGHVKFDENRNPNKKITFVKVENNKLILKEKFGE